MPDEEPRFFLVAAGTEHYDDGDELASVPDDLRKMAAFFGQRGYREQLAEVRLDPSSTALRRALSEWLNGSDRRASDTAVIYYSGHGDSQADFYYLLTADSKENRYADTALRADYVLEALGETPRVRRVLLILDACYAGKGAFDAARVAARVSPYLDLSGDDEGVWVVTAASPKQEAQERVFADAFVTAAEQLGEITPPLQQYIGLEMLIAQINVILKQSGKQQRASWTPATLARGIAPFIPNPRFEPDAPANMNLETRDLLRRQGEAGLVEYWGPTARGVEIGAQENEGITGRRTAPTEEVAAQAGWYFTGRRAVITELAGWLADPAADTRLRVLTGDPGSGKSAVLSRLVALADPVLAPTFAHAESDLDFMPISGSISAALVARGKTADELFAELAGSLGVASSAELAETLGLRPLFSVVIDGLDEATDPPAVIERFVSPLTAAASPGRGPRVLVATRRYRHLIASLPADRVTVDLDEDAYRNDTDTASYVTKVLLAEGDSNFPSPYRGLRDVARRVADEVAAMAGGSFLIAQIAARVLARSPQPFDPAEVSAEPLRWAQDVGAAFDRDLERYGEKAHRIRDLLAALAWAEGTGLPHELWAPVATALAADETYAQADIVWVIEQAGFYLVETRDQERSVYRLYHEQFAERLRQARRPSTAHQLITSELLRHVPAAADGRREWLAAAPYIRTHLATHAGNAEMLDALVIDPGFLLAADTARLLPMLATITYLEAQKSASAFESTQHLLTGQPPGQAAAQLDLAAHIHGATMLIDGINQLPYKRPWTITSGHWARPDRHILLGRTSEQIEAVGIATLDGVPAAVTAGRDGTARMWDLRAGAARGEPFHGPDGYVFAVAVGLVDGTPVAVTGGHDGAQVWDLRAGAARGAPLRHAETVTAVGVGEVDGTPVAVTGSTDGTVQVWDLRAEAARGEPLRGHTRWVKAIAVGEVDGTPVAVTGSEDGTVRIWDLRAGVARGEPLLGRANPISGSPDTVSAVAVGQVDGTPVAVTGSSEGDVTVWDLRAGAARGEPLPAHTSTVAAVAVGRVGDTPVAVTGGAFTVMVWDLRAGTLRGKPLRGHDGMVSAVAVGEVDGTPVAVTGGEDGTVRMWDLQTRTLPGEPLRHDSSWGTAVALGLVDGVPMAITSLRGTDPLQMWDLRPGATRENLLYSHPGQWIERITIGELDGTPVAVTGGGNKVEVWNLRTGETREHKVSLLRKVLSRLSHLTLFESTRGIYSIAIGEVDGAPVAVTGDNKGTVRVWDLRTGVTRGKPLRGHPKGWVSKVAIGEVDGAPVAVTGDTEGTVRVWDLRAGAARGEPLHSAGKVTAVAVGKVDQAPLAITGGDDGTVQVWDLRAGVARGEPLRGHTSRVRTVAVGEADGSPVLVSGDESGTILVRDLRSTQRVVARLDAPSAIKLIAFAGTNGWLTATEDGSLFTWCPATTSSRVPAQP
jgi:WD40 repeat protein